MSDVISIWDDGDTDDTHAEARARRWRGETTRGFFEPSVAAEWYAEQCFYSGDYPKEQTIYVRTSDGVVHVFDVETEYHASFNATEREP